MKNMNEQNEKTQDERNKEGLSKKIILAAKRGELRMRPKWHFVLRAGLWITGIAAAVLATLYFLSLFLFITRETGIWMAPMFGWRGVFVFLSSLPWLIILSILIFVLILEILVRRYAFAYRLPLLYSAFAILLAVFAGGLLLAQTPLHQILSNCPSPRDLRDKKDLPVQPPCGTGVYRDLAPRRFNDFHYGVIDSFDGDNFIILNRHQEKILVVVGKKTRLPLGAQFEAGDAVVVIGEHRGGQVEAFGVGGLDY